MDKSQLIDNIYNQLLLTPYTHNDILDILDKIKNKVIQFNGTIQEFAAEVNSSYKEDD